VRKFLLILGLGLTLLVGFILGANDAATPCDTAVGSGVLSVRKAIILFSVFTTIGALTQGYMIMKTIGTGIVPKVDVLGALTIVLAASIWLLIASAKGIELSVTNTIVGSVIGYGIVAVGLEKMKIDVLYKIFLSWVTSPILSIFLSFILYSLLFRILKKRIKKRKIDKLFRACLIFALCFSAYSFGANDIGNATGVYVTVLGIKPEEMNPMTTLPLALLGCFGVLLGGLVLGPRVIRTVGYKITRLDPMSGSVAELSNALTVYLFTSISYSVTVCPSQRL
jgi:PiT family inorganic phosphate transporter